MGSNNPSVPTVSTGTFELPSGKVIDVGDRAWFNWLASEDARSFRFEGKKGTFTARKEFPKHGQPYWSAYRKKEGQQRRTYLGKPEAISLEKMEETADKLVQYLAEPPKRQKASPDSVAPSVAVKTRDSESSKLQGEVEKLQKELGSLRAEIPGLIQSQIQAAIAGAAAGEQSLGESERLREENEALRRELEQARTEIEELKRQNLELDAEAARESAKTGEVDLKLQDALGEVAALKAEIEKLRSQLAAQPAASAPVLDYRELSDRALASLKLGSAAPGYKAAKKAIAKFIELMGG